MNPTEILEVKSCQLFVKKTVKKVALIGILVSIIFQSWAKKPEKPNIIIIMADDMGYSLSGITVWLEGIFASEQQAMNYMKVGGWCT